MNGKYGTVGWCGQVSDIVFAKTRHTYDTYTDFWRLVEISGFPIIFVDEIDISEYKVFITSPINGEIRPHVDNQKERPRNAHIISWNIERPSGSRGTVGNYAKANRDLIYNRHVDEIWVSDRRLAEETHLRFVVLGSDEGLGQPGTVKNYLFCHMSYETGRRQSIYKHFGKEQIGPNAWPPERDGILKASRFALNVHQDQHPFQEPLRFSLFAAYGIPILSETILDSYPWSDEFMVFSHFDGLVSKLRQMEGNDYGRWREMANRARDRMTKQFRFKDMVEQAVWESTENWR